MTNKPSENKQPLNPADGAQTDFSGRMAYLDYLKLDDILGAQAPKSQTHDEMLFIIQHQTSELWLKLAIHELSSARRAMRNDELQPAFKMLARVSRIFEQLNNAWDVLRTMTPSEYTQFRDTLGQSSGFQSWQYRQIEFILGNRNNAMLKPHTHRPEILQLLQDELQTPSIYDEALALLGRNGIAILPEALRRDVSDPYQENDQITLAWQTVYEHSDQYWSCYELAEKLVDLEDYFRRWRFNHVTTVERIIGDKRGTGGTRGVSYLRKMLDVELFPELWRVRTLL